jgi:tRNA(adenine34) deaminase
MVTAEEESGSHAPGEPDENRDGEAGSPFDRAMMGRALEMAREAGNLGEVPVGAVVVLDGRIISQAFNLRETLDDPTAHAERLALTWAGRTLGTWRLDDCVLYVTLEPCAMCAGAIVLSRLGRLVYGAVDPKAGACRSLYRIVSDPRLNHRVGVTAGVLGAECREILTDFFQERRKYRKLMAAAMGKPSSCEAR